MKAHRSGFNNLLIACAVSLAVVKRGLKRDARMTPPNSASWVAGIPFECHPSVGAEDTDTAGAGGPAIAVVKLDERGRVGYGWAAWAAVVT